MRRRDGTLYPSAEKTLNYPSSLFFMQPVVFFTSLLPENKIPPGIRPEEFYFIYSAAKLSP